MLKIGYFLARIGKFMLCEKLKTAVFQAFFEGKGFWKLPVVYCQKVYILTVNELREVLYNMHNDTAINNWKNHQIIKNILLVFF